MLLDQSVSSVSMRTADPGDAVQCPWFAVWTHSNCEERVREQLAEKGFRTFLPTVRDWSRRAGVRRLISRPMFPSYLFVQHQIEKHSYVEIMKTKGLVRILGERWDRLEPIPTGEVDAIRRVVNMANCRCCRIRISGRGSGSASPMEHWRGSRAFSSGRGHSAGFSF